MTSFMHILHHPSNFSSVSPLWVCVCLEALSSSLETRAQGEDTRDGVKDTCTYRPHVFRL